MVMASANFIPSLTRRGCFSNLMRVMEAIAFWFLTTLLNVPKRMATVYGGRRRLD
jgi:hypothetical protein